MSDTVILFLGDGILSPLFSSRFSLGFLTNYHPLYSDKQYAISFISTLFPLSLLNPYCFIPKWNTVVLATFGITFLTFELLNCIGVLSQDLFFRKLGNNNTTIFHSYPHHFTYSPSLWTFYSLH